jgi:hypothetical protein
MNMTDRKFSVYLFWVSHGVLLLRSGVSSDYPTRIDVLFHDVVWMSLPTWMNGLAIEECSLSEMLSQLPRSLHEEVALRRIYRLVTEQTASYVVCGGMTTAEDSLGYFEPSSLTQVSILVQNGSHARR